MLQTLHDGVRTYLFIQTKGIELRWIKRGVTSPNVQLFLLNINWSNLNILKILVYFFRPVRYARKEEIYTRSVSFNFSTLDQDFVPTWKMLGNISNCVNKMFLYFTASLVLAWITIWRKYILESILLQHISIWSELAINGSNFNKFLNQKQILENLSHKSLISSRKQLTAFAFCS